MQNQVQAFIDTAESFLKGVRDRAYDTLYNSIGEVTGTQQVIINKVAVSINAVLELAHTRYQSLADGIKNGFNATIDQVQASINTFTYDALANINDIANDALLELGSTQQMVLDDLDTTTASISTDAQSIIDTIKAKISSTVTTILDSVGGIIAQLPDIGMQVINAMIGIAPELLAPVIDAGKGIVDGVKGVSSAVALFSKLGELTKIMHSPEEAIEMIQSLPDGELPGKWTPGGLADIKSASWTGALVGAPMGFLPMLSTIFGAGLGEKMAMTARSIYKPARMGIAEMALALVRENIEPAKFLTDAASLGFSESDAMEYVRLTRQYLTVQDTIALWLRGDMLTPELDDYLARSGIAEIDRERLKSLAYFIPSVNDLIHMAVREAFTPEIAEKFGQYQDFPEAVAEWGEKQGLSKEWAHRYWAAHWELPSADMGFAMYQRKIIDLDTLKMLLKALDVMPYWRDNMVKLAYQTITRVDIRRIHKMKLIDDAELQQRYETIGYSPADAAMLVKFTIELNKEEVKIETQGQRDLTASEILNAYANSAVSPDDAVKMLTDLGYDENEIALKLVLAELPALKRVRDKQIAIINQRLMYGRLDINGAVDALNKLDMTQAEIDYTLADWQLDLELQQFKAEDASAKSAATKAATKSS